MKKDKATDNKEIEELKKQLEDVSNSWKRALADYQNLERRAGIEKEEFAKYAKSSLIIKLLPALDNLDALGKHSHDQGLIICIKSLQNVLDKEGLSEIQVFGKEFDPHRMEAIETVEGEKDGMVVEVLQKGYQLFDKVIRPARVKVTKKIHTRQSNN